MPPTVQHVRPIIGMEIHVELSTRAKVFAHAPSPACTLLEPAGANVMTDELVLALPGSLPVLNRRAVELSMLVGMALGCAIADLAVWDRKSYFYPDLPKAYQISQYADPICGPGVVEVPGLDEQGEIDLDADPTPIRITRAHLEEDAGKLVHDCAGGTGTGVDLNRAGTPLLEIVTEPDFVSAAQCVAFARELRRVCRFVGATLGVMQRGHMRFEPNINCELTLSDGRKVRTPIVEVKNLNSFRALAGAVDYELRAQPERYLEDGREMGVGAKSTRGWDDERMTTVAQRDKEDAHDYRYFPDPDLPPVVVDAAWRERVRAALCELPMSRLRRYVKDYGLALKQGEQLVEERPVCDLLDASVEAAAATGMDPNDAGRQAANLLLQAGARIANERAQETGDPVLPSDLGVNAPQIAALLAMRAEGAISADGVDTVFEALASGEHAGGDARLVAETLGVIIVRDEGQLETWCDEAIAAMPEIADDVRAGKVQAVGRLIGDVRKRSGGSADAKSVREMLLNKLGQG